MVKIRFLSIFLILVGFFLAYFNAVPFLFKDSFFNRIPFKLGLDLQGGTHLVYRADTSEINSGEISDAMAGLRDVIERRVNLFGVTEPLVQIERKGGEERLIVELAGISDINEAIKLIGETPYLEFRRERPEEERDEILKAQENGSRLSEDPYFIPTQLTGRFLKKATLEFDQTTFEPTVLLEFSKEGEKIFAELTKKNVGKRLAIYLDGAPISAPTVREEITSGRAQITGQFTPKEAKTLVQRLNSGALPLPIELISQQTVGASLGEDSLIKGIKAGIFGVALIALFLIFWYRLPGFIAVLALAIYTVIMLSLFRLVPVTLTAAGIAGFILSIGVAVDANILIFERFKEEKKTGKDLQNSLKEGFGRAWPSIRDSNISSLITSTILYWFGSSLIKGFALTLGIGVLISMFSAITVTRTFLLALNISEGRRITNFLFGYKGR
jgi:protein-export membrane protein SecD